MEKKYNGFTMIRTEKLSARYGFSANDKKIKVQADLYDLDSDIIWEEAVMVRQVYCDKVQACKAQGEKPKPAQIKSQAFEYAKDQMSTKYGESYLSLFSPVKKVREIKPTNKKVLPTEGDDLAKTINTNTVQKVNEDFTMEVESLLSEFEETSVQVPKVKLNVIDIASLNPVSKSEDFKPRKEMVEDTTYDEELEDVAVSDLSIFDTEIDIDDFFGDLF